MSPAILRAMFYPRSNAVFRLEAELSWRDPDDGSGRPRSEFEMTLEVGLAKALENDVQHRGPQLEV
jgi:hypothetical protein